MVVSGAVLLLSPAWLVVLLVCWSLLFGGCVLFLLLLEDVTSLHGVFVGGGGCVFPACREWSAFPGPRSRFISEGVIDSPAYFGLSASEGCAAQCRPHSSRRAMCSCSQHASTARSRIESYESNPPIC